jgi:glycerophosphoryl diester phosphodiesterase
MHDATVDRTTDGTGPIAEKTLVELKALMVGGKERVPTLAETLELVRGRCKLLVEIKPAGITDDVVRVIREAGMAADCTISSFDEPSLLRARELGLETAYFQIRPQPFDAREVVRRPGDPHADRLAGRDQRGTAGGGARGWDARPLRLWGRAHV